MTLRLEQELKTAALAHCLDSCVPRISHHCLLFLDSTKLDMDGPRPSIYGPPLSQDFAGYVVCDQPNEDLNGFAGYIVVAAHPTRELGEKEPHLGEG